MKAGRELDAIKIRVAVEVFGWKETDKRLPDHDPNWLEYEAPWFELPDGSIFHHTHMPDYPRRIADAWLVVEKIDVLSFGIEKRRKDNLWWVVFIQDDDDTTQWHSAEADTAPLAICLAALKAVKVT